MLLIQGTIRIAPENVADARPVMQQMIEASRREKGCQHYSYAIDLLDPGLIHVSEAWDSRAALDAHFASAHLQRWRECWPRLGISDRNLTLYQDALASPI